MTNPVDRQEELQEQELLEQPHRDQERREHDLEEQERREQERGDQERQEQQEHEYVDESTPLLVKHSRSRRFLIPPQPHSYLTRFILNHSHSPFGLLTSVGLNENDLSVNPIGVDLDLDRDLDANSNFAQNAQQERIKTSRLFLLRFDIFKAIILCIQTIYTANQFIGPFSNSNQPFNPYWYKHVYFPLSYPSQYTIHLLTLICSPGLHFSLGCSAVLAIHTRRCLGWRSHEIFFRALKLGLSLLVLNQLLMSQTIIQTRGKVILMTLPIWSLGWNLIFITTILIGLFLLERTMLIYFYKKTDQCPLPVTDLNDLDENIETKWMKTCANQIRTAINTSLVLGTVFVPLLVAYALPGNRENPDQDWWIEWAQTRPPWFWFFVAPTPEMSAHPEFRMVSNFAPVGWLPFVLLGAFYARCWIRQPHGRLGMFSWHMKLAIFSTLIFLFTRIFDIGNLAVPYTNETIPPHSVKPRLLRWLRGSWEMVFYTTAYPPDLGHIFFGSLLIFLLLALLDLFPQAFLNFNPLLQFGRAPIFFYSIQLLSFHYLLPSVLVILDWPRHLNLVWITIVSLCSWPILWLFCEAWVVFKDRKGAESIWRFF